jgi:hypothetical protein
MVQTSTADMFRCLDAEAFLTRCLKEHGCETFAGVTEADERRERIRYAILGAGLDVVIVGRKAGTKNPETYAEAFERVYGEPLEPKQRRGKQARNRK